jgi:hypothetical protein
MVQGVSEIGQTGRDGALSDTHLQAFGIGRPQLCFLYSDPHP